MGQAVADPVIRSTGVSRPRAGASTDSGAEVIRPSGRPRGNRLRYPGRLTVRRGQSRRHRSRPDEVYLARRADGVEVVVRIHQPHWGQTGIGCGFGQEINMLRRLSTVDHVAEIFDGACVPYGRPFVVSESTARAGRWPNMWRRSGGRPRRNTSASVASSLARSPRRMPGTSSIVICGRPTGASTPMVNRSEATRLICFAAWRTSSAAGAAPVRRTRGVPARVDVRRRR